MTKENQSQKPEVPKVDAKFVAKQYAIGYGAWWLSGIIIIVPAIILWVILYFILIKTGWIFSISANTRGVMIIAAIFIPLLIGAILRPIIRNYLLEKWHK